MHIPKQRAMGIVMRSLAIYISHLSKTKGVLYDSRNWRQNKRQSLAVRKEGHPEQHGAPFADCPLERLR